MSRFLCASYLLLGTLSIQSTSARLRSSSAELVAAAALSASDVKASSPLEALSREYRQSASEFLNGARDSADGIRSTIR
jgi:hypothetical protein